MGEGLRVAFVLFAVFLVSGFAAASEPYPDGPFSAAIQYDGSIQATPMNSFEFSSFTQVVETRPGGALVTRKSPGVTDYENLIVTVPTEDTLSDHSNLRLKSWYDLDAGSPYKMKDVIVRIMDGEHNTQAMYFFYRMLPSSRRTFSKGGTQYAAYNFTYTSFERDLET